jgi:hypothetical protein
MRNTRPETIRLTCAILILASLLLSLTVAATATLSPSPVKRLAEDSSSTAPQPATDEATRRRVSEAYGKLPLSFEENQGQTDRKVKFLSRGRGYTLLLTETEAVLSLRSEKAADADSEKSPLEKSEMQSSVLRMKLIGANQSPRIEGRDQLTGKSNYLVGSDRQKWRTDIPNFARVYYSAVYPGIDLVYYGTNQRQLEYDFVVAPNADPRSIRLSFDGADAMSLEADGSLRLKMKGGEVSQPAPVIYQETESGEKQQVAGHYVLKGGGEVAFEVADYDRSRQLVIDPQLLYATFYGGSDDDVANDIAVDGNGNAYIAGETFSADLILSNAFQGALNGATDAFITKLNASGTGIIYSTYLGGVFSDQANAIAVMSDGKACITGRVGNTSSGSDFPTTSNRFQGNGNFLNNRESDAFVTVLTPGGNGLFYSTFFGGNRPSPLIASLGQDEGLGIAVDSSNKVYITGKSDSPDLPTKNAFQNTWSANDDAFIAKFDPTQSGNNSLIYSSYLGGGGGDFANDIAVTPAGVAFMVGVTGSFDYPTKSSSALPPFDTTQGGVNDSFIAKVSPSGALIYSTYFGGNNRDEAQGVAVDSDERAYVTGLTVSSAATFPLRNAFQPNRTSTSSEGFVAKFNADGTALFYSSFLGGGGFNTELNDIAIDAAGNAYVTGFTNANPFASVNGFPSSVPPGNVMVAKIEASDATGTTTPKLLYKDNFGGVSASGGFNGEGNGIAVDPRGNVYIAGSAGSNFTTTPGAFQETFRGGDSGQFGTNSDGFVVKIGSTFNDTIGLFRPSNGQFQLRNSNTAGSAEISEDFGQSGDQPLAGDWNGDGVDNPGVFRPSTGQFLLQQPTRLTPTAPIINITITLNFGLSGDKAIVGDWNGDGIDTVGVFRPSASQFILSNAPNTNNSSPSADLTFSFGQSADTPVAGDWDGDGIDTVGTFRVAGECGFLLTNNNSTINITANGFCTVAGESPLPVMGDWNGDGLDTPGVYSSALTKFFLTNSSATLTAPAELQFDFGRIGGRPVAGDWDGKPANTPPNSGINDPADGSSRIGQTQVFTTTCSDPDGWHDIRTINFKITHSKNSGRDREDEDRDERVRGKGKNKDDDDKDKGDGEPLILWVRFNENKNLIRLYDPDLEAWRDGTPGSNVVLENRFVRLNLAGTTVVGTGPLGPSVQVRWEVVFKKAAKGNNYKQYLKITDDEGESTGFDRVGRWSVLK